MHGPIADAAIVSPDVLLSTIIATHDRPAVLQRCLESLQAQDVDRSRIEVLVIDDGSRHDVTTLVSRVAAAGPITMRCERQPLSGLNTARNRGVAATRGEVLAFLDDDTIVAPGWAAALLNAFATHPCAAVGGRVELGLEGPEPPWVAPRRYYLSEYDLGRKARWIEAEDPVPVGANCAVRRTVFSRAGGFRAGLDRIGTSLVSNGDTEFFRRLRAGGERLRYEPGAKVTHCVPEERLTVGFFLKRHYAQGVSDELLLTSEGRAPTLRRRAGVVRELALELPHTAKVLVEDLLHGRGTFTTRFSACYWAGRLAGAAMDITVEAGSTELEPSRARSAGRSRDAPSPP
jgi:GT2 family glycosyltransferase